MLDVSQAMTMRTLLCLVLVITSGCATTQTTAMVPVAKVSATRQVEGGDVRVGLVSIFSDIITCEVVNAGREPLVVDRDAVVMVTPLGEQRTRVPGGLQSTYQIAGGGEHVVNLRFNLDGVLDDDVVQLDFSHAISRGGQPVTGLPLLAIKPNQQTR